MKKNVVLGSLMAGLIAGLSVAPATVFADNHEGGASAHADAAPAKKKKKDKKKHVAKKANGAEGDKNQCSGKDGCNGHDNGEAKKDEHSGH